MSDNHKKDIIIELPTLYNASDREEPELEDLGIDPEKILSLQIFNIEFITSWVEAKNPENTILKHNGGNFEIAMDYKKLTYILKSFFDFRDIS